MAEDFRGINQETLKNVEALKGSMKEIADATAAANRSLQQQGRLIQDYKSNFNSIVTSSSQFAKLQDEASRSASATGKALKEQQTQLSNIRSLNAQIENLMDQMVNASKEEEKLLLRQVNNLSAAKDNAKELANAYGDLVDSSSQLDKSTMWFSAFSEVVKDIPGLRKLSSPFELAAKAARETAINNAKIQTTNENIASLGKEALRTGRGLTKEKLKELGLTEQVGNLTGSAAAQSLRSYQQNNKVTSTGIAGMQAGFKSLGPIIKGALGPLAIITTIVSAIKFFVQAMFEADKRITDISKNLSISKEAAEGIYQNIINTKESTDDLRYTTTELTKAFSELSSLSDFTSISTKDQLKTQVELTKMLGLQVDEALQLQELFSVNNIEAEAGVDAIYDQVAAFANQNKLIADGRKILSEVAKTSNIIKINFKGNTSELVKATLEAKKLGLNLDQVNKVADSLLNFEQSISSELEAELLLGKDINLEKAREFALTNNIAGLTGEIAKQGITAEKFSRLNRIQQEALANTLGMSSNELADSLYKQELIQKTAGNVTKELKKQAEELRKQGEGEKAIRLEKQATAIEQGIVEGRNLKEAQKRASAEEKFNAALERAKELFSDMAQPGGILDKIVDTLGAIFGLEEQKSKKSLEKQGYTIKESSGLFGSGLFKSNQLFKDGKRLDVNYGSKGVQEFEKEYGIKSEPETVNDFILRPGQKPIKFNKDDIVIGGTNLGGGNNSEVISLLKELISVVKQGGNVYLDGTKVGTAMNVSTYRIQ